MESLGKLKDDFLIKKLEEESSTIDLYVGLDTASQSDLSAEVSAHLPSSCLHVHPRQTLAVFYNMSVFD